MKYAAIASLLAVGASAAPTLETRSADVEAFHLMSLRSASPIHFGSFSAAESNIFINYPQGEQGATCDGKADNSATFSLKDGELFLYNKDSPRAQQVYVDRSGMGTFGLSSGRRKNRTDANISRAGQGKMGYISEGQSPPRNAELSGWTSEKNGDFDYLKFDGTTLIACPAATEGSWVVWVNAGVSNPGGSEGCLGLSAMVQPDEKPVSCEYTQ